MQQREGESGCDVSGRERAAGGTAMNREQRDSVEWERVEAEVEAMRTKEAEA